MRYTEPDEVEDEGPVEHLSDDLDRAARRADELVADGIEVARLAQARMPEPDGRCMWCEEEIEDVPRARFCDADCAAMWQNYRETRRRQGHVDVD